MTHILAFVLGGWFGLFIGAMCAAAREGDDNKGTTAQDPEDEQ